MTFTEALAKLSISCNVKTQLGAPLSELQLLNFLELQDQSTYPLGKRNGAQLVVEDGAPWATL